MTLQFSIIIPAYNAGPYIADCLESVHRAVAHYRLPDHVEVIVVNDASTDDTADKASWYMDHRTRVYTQPQNMGPCVARNTGLAHASGTYVIFLDADNRLTTDAFAIIDKSLQDMPEKDAIVLGMDLIDHHGTTTGSFYRDHIKVDPEQHLMASKESLFLSNFLDNFSVIKRQAFDDLRYDETLTALEDWDLWLRFLFVYHLAIGFQPEVCGQYRLRPDSRSQARASTLPYQDATLTIYGRILVIGRDYPIPPAVLDGIYQRIYTLSLNVAQSSGYKDINPS